MGLSCACDDFDKGDYDHWWEPGRNSIPPVGSKCSECDAPLPNQKCVSILKFEVWDGPEEHRPPHPEDVLGSEPEDSILSRHWDQRYAAMEGALDDYDDEYGWDSDYERFERHTMTYRCERCADLADAIEDLGYCMIAPGDLIESHCEYVEESGGHEITWKRDVSGVFNPVHMTASDFRARERRYRWNRIKSFVRYGWRDAFRDRIWWPTKNAVMRAYGR